MADLQELYDAVLNGDQKKALAVTEEALAAGADPQTIVNDHMIPAMDEVGRRFECNEFFVPELLIAARAMKGALQIVKPHLAAAGAKPVGIVAIGTVKGDLHDIGKNLVSSMLEGAGFEIVDLGVDVTGYVETLETDNNIDPLPAPGARGQGGYSPGHAGSDGARGDALAIRVFIDE
jgi:5-methyltetrahydrofolate--homocysteine methyltransferase